jgi:monothiol glutaredoxin
MSRLLRSNLLSRNVLQKASTPFRPTLISSLNIRPLQIRLLTDEARSGIEQAIKRTSPPPDLMPEKPVVLFMKGTPSAPQCGFSRATVQILGLQGVDPQKFVSYNVLEDNELRSGTYHGNLTQGSKNTQNGLRCRSCM